MVNSKLRRGARTRHGDRASRLARTVLGSSGLRSVTWGVVLAVVATSMSAGEAQPKAVQAAPIPPLRAIAVDGTAHTLGEQAGLQATVLVFLGTECPIARKYMPTLNHLAEQFQTRHVAWYGVVSEPHTTREAIARFAQEYNCRFPLLVDASLAWARQFVPRRVPEALVLSPAGQVCYRGRIDDRFASLGVARPAPTEHSLQLAVEAVLTSQPVASPETPVVGCLFEALRPSAAVAGPTFHRDVAPILRQGCADCHRPGEVAPFSLLTYAEASNRAAQIAEVVASRYMPPSKAVPGIGHFRGQKRLSDHELSVIDQWASQGAPEGDPADSPPAPHFPTGWRLGEPDIVLELPAEFEIPAAGQNVFRWFALPIDLPVEKAVVAFEFQPGNRQVVHHALLFLDATGAAVRLDQRDPAPGYENFGGPGFIPTGFLGSWGPGYAPRPFPPGTGVFLKPRTSVALQMHYTNTGKVEHDRSRIGLYLADTAGLSSITTIPILSVDIDIPAGTTDHQVQAEFTVPVAVRVLGLSPHMHYLGRNMSVTAHSPAGVPNALIAIENWDFNWQDQYQLVEPLALAAGTRLVVEARYDNSAGNPKNPHAPPQAVHYGSQSTDEMCLVGVQVALEKPSDFNAIAAALIRQYLQSRDGRPFVNPFE